MKAVFVFLLVALVALGLVVFDYWLVSDQPTHVIRVAPTPKPK